MRTCERHIYWASKVASWQRLGTVLHWGPDTGGMAKMASGTRDEDAERRSLLLGDTPLDAYGFRPTWRGRVHFVAALIAAPAALFLWMMADSAVAKVSVSVFALSLVGMFAVSAAYHRIARTPERVKWFRRADHSMIFILIAGTYTPICLLALPAGWGITMLVAVWVVALAGVTFKMARVNTSSGSWLYIVLGWAAVIVTPALIQNLDGAQLVLMGAGGLLYTIGAIGLATRWPDPVPHRFGYHEVWHTMTVAAGGCHFALVALVLP